MSFIYIASPYTHQDPIVVQRRFEQVERITAAMLKAGIHAYSPIVHCHELAKKYKLPVRFDFWRDHNFAILAKASQLTVVCLEGWQTSKGITEERNLATMLSIPIRYRMEDADSRPSKS